MCHLVYLYTVILQVRFYCESDYLAIFGYVLHCKLARTVFLIFSWLLGLFNHTPLTTSLHKCSKLV